jgi:hypothetical protein
MFIAFCHATNWRSVGVRCTSTHVAPNGANHYLLSLGYKYAAPSGAKTIDPACYYRLSGFQFDDRPTSHRAKAEM